MYALILMAKWLYGYMVLKTILEMEWKKPSENSLQTFIFGSSNSLIMKTSRHNIAFLKGTLSILIVFTMLSQLHAHVKDSSDPNQLIGHAMPAINGTTI